MTLLILAEAEREFAESGGGGGALIFSNVAKRDASESPSSGRWLFRLIVAAARVRARFARRSLKGRWLRRARADSPGSVSISGARPGRRDKDKQDTPRASDRGRRCRA